MTARILYSALFVVVVPVLLVVWAMAGKENVALPVFGTEWLGTVIAVAGFGVLLLGMYELWHIGGGLPMNAFPPPRLVVNGAFGVVPHPIYTGFVLLVFGISMAAHSACGLWLVTPSVAFACAALVMGYEHPDLQRRFGSTLRILPADDDGVPSTLERVRFLVLVVGPWLVLYALTVELPLHGTAFAFSFEDRLPIVSWTTLLYQSTYVAVVLAPWSARTRRELRKLMISGWTATVLVFPFYWLVPSNAPRRPLSDPGGLSALLSFERDSYPPSVAFPSFHVLWTIFVARLYRPRWLGVGYVAAVAVSCVTTGMHYIADVVAAMVIAPPLCEPERVWGMLRSAAERLANSWSEWRFGPVRVISYAAYAGAAAFVQLVIVTAALGAGREWEVLVTATSGLLVAGAWAQFVEGSSRLRRPFGFYGGLIGVGIACLFFEDRWTLLAANCVAAPWMQAIGRLRCLVNGCCHGRPAEPNIGIRVTHPRSRVSHLAGLTDIPIHPTQLYSILCNILLGVFLARMWISGCPLALIVGVYGIGNGLARFAEEAYRGEPQTSAILGLRLYQWLAIGTVLTGAALSTVRSAAAPSWHLSLAGLAIATAFSVVAATALGVDFPDGKQVLSRLT